jgi:hypothetical protein
MRIYVNVSYAERNNAKKLGGQFDSICKKWYAPTGYEKALISQYGDKESEILMQRQLFTLAKQLIPELPLCQISKGFLEGHYTYPGFIFR